MFFFLFSFFLFTATRCRAVVRLTVAISISFWKGEYRRGGMRRVSIMGQSRTRSTAARDDLWWFARSWYECCLCRVTFETLPILRRDFGYRDLWFLNGVVIYRWLAPGWLTRLSFFLLLLLLLLQTAGKVETAVGNRWMERRNKTSRMRTDNVGLLTFIPSICDYDFIFIFISFELPRGGRRIWFILVCCCLENNPNFRFYSNVRCQHLSWSVCASWNFPLLFIRFVVVKSLGACCARWSTWKWLLWVTEKTYGWTSEWSRERARERKQTEITRETCVGLLI